MYTRRTENYSDTSHSRDLYCKIMFILKLPIINEVVTTVGHETERVELRFSYVGHFSLMAIIFRNILLDVYRYLTQNLFIIGSYSFFNHRVSSYQSFVLSSHFVKRRTICNR